MNKYAAIAFVAVALGFILWLAYTLWPLGVAI